MDDLDGNIVSDSGTILTFVCILIWASVEFVFNLFKQTIIPFSFIPFYTKFFRKD